MKYKILLLSGALFFTSWAIAQKNKLTAYAITSTQQGQFVWGDVKLIDLTTGEILQNVYGNNSLDFQAFHARDQKPISFKSANGVVTDHTRLPFSSFSAACAFDKKHNRLYFTPMYLNELRYIDLNAASPKMYYFSGEQLSKAASLNDEANHITRMAIGADGNGYALSNDASHLVRFTTGKKQEITDLGSIQDDPSNGAISIRNRCTSWGGDMIAAADNSLYVISANHSVFRISISHRLAKYMGAIEGLPANYTTNGAAVSDDGKLIVSSANSTAGYFSVDPKTWKATKLDSKGSVFNTSDLANGNLIFQNEKRAETMPLVTRALTRNNKISLYPNPVSEGVFRVSFDNDELGRYEIQLIDIAGRILMQKPVVIANKGQVVEVPLSKPFAKGMYMVKVLNATKKSVHSDKIIIE